jgi:hypothetical protein
VHGRRGPAAAGVSSSSGAIAHGGGALAALRAAAPARSARGRRVWPGAAPGWVGLSQQARLLASAAAPAPVAPGVAPHGVAVPGSGARPRGGPGSAVRARGLQPPPRVHGAARARALTRRLSVPAREPGEGVTHRRAAARVRPPCAHGRTALPAPVRVAQRAVPRRLRHGLPQRGHGSPRRARAGPRRCMGSGPGGAQPQRCAGVAPGSTARCGRGCSAVRRHACGRLGPCAGVSRARARSPASARPSVRARCPQRADRASGHGASWSGHFSPARTRP